jgi:hypothetical protein
MSRAQGPHKTGAKREKHSPAPTGADLRFTRTNYLVLGAALGCIVLGYVLLALGSITAAPLLLVAGYCVLVPYGLSLGQGAARRVGDPPPQPGE